MEVVIITYEQKNLPLAFDFSDKIRFYDLDDMTVDAIGIWEK